MKKRIIRVTAIILAGLLGLTDPVSALAVETAGESEAEVSDIPGDDAGIETDGTSQESETAVDELLEETSLTGSDPDESTEPEADEYIPDISELTDEADTDIVMPDETPDYSSDVMPDETAEDVSGEVAADDVPEWGEYVNKYAGVDGYHELEMDYEQVELNPEIVYEGEIVPVGAAYNDLPSAYVPTKNAALNYLPPLRDQGDFNTCWAYSSIALGEINMIKEGKADKSIDLSELHLSYFTYNTPADPLKGTTGDVNTYRTDYASSKGGLLGVGGNLTFTSNILAGWVGAADEKTSPYSDADKVNAGTKKPDIKIAYQDTAHLDNYYVAKYRLKDLTPIKNLIYENGGAGISMYADTNYYNAAKNAFYNFEISGTNHAVTLVGWNDNFSLYDLTVKDSRGRLHSPEGDGAWLVRNSWSDGDGADEEDFYEYFWLSYYDCSLINKDVYSFTFDNASTYDHNYQYDGGMYTGNSGYSQGANIFQTSSRGAYGELIKAVSFATLSANVSYTVDVYTNLTDETSPESGIHRDKVTGTTSYAGYYTVPLHTAIPVSNQEKFSVVVKLKNAENGIAREYPLTNSDWAYTKPSAEAGCSYVFNGSSWTDYGAQTDSNLRIKAFTKDSDEFYSIIYNPNGGIGRVFNRAEYLGESVIISEPGDFYKTGYRFDSWNTKADGTGTRYDEGVMCGSLSTVKNGKVNLYAQWIPNVYDVTYRAGGGQILIPTGTAYDGSVITKGIEFLTVPETFDTYYQGMPEATRYGYDLDGWYTTESGSGGVKLQPGKTKVAIDRDHNIYARWKPKTSKVIFDKNGGASAPAQITVTYGEKYSNLPKTNPSRSGHTFRGWYTEPNGGRLITSDTIVTEIGDHTLYAGWIENTALENQKDDLAVTSVTLNKTKCVLEQGNSVSLKATAYPTTAPQTFKWTKSDKGGVIKITPGTDSSLMTVTALGKAGEATVTVVSPSGKKASCKITVTQDRSLTIAPKGKGRCAVGKTIELTASSGSTKLKNTSLIWSAEGVIDNTGTEIPDLKPGEASVNKSGILTGVSEGTVRVTATNPSTGVSATCLVKIYIPLKKASLSAKSIVMTSGSTYKIDLKKSPSNATMSDVDGYDVKWVSSDPTHIIVSSNGLITAKANTKTPVTVKATFRTYTGKESTLKCTVTVADKKLTSVAISPKTVTIGAGETKELKAVCDPLIPDNLEGFEWHSSNTGVAVVSGLTGEGDPLGRAVIRALNPGTTVITVIATDSKGKTRKARCNVTVGQRPDHVVLFRGKTKLENDDTPMLAMGKTMTLKASVSSDRLGRRKAPSQSVRWISSDPGTVYVSSSGKVTPIKPGTATIRAEYTGNSDVFETCNIQVYTPVSRIRLDKTTMTILDEGTNSYEVITPIVSPAAADFKSIVWTMQGTDIEVLPVTTSNLYVPAATTTASKRYILSNLREYKSLYKKTVTISPGQSLAIHGIHPGTVKLTAVITDAGGATKRIECSVKVKRLKK